MSPFGHPRVQKHWDTSAVTGSLTSIPGKIELVLKDRIALSHLFLCLLENMVCIAKGRAQTSNFNY